MATIPTPLSDAEIAAKRKQLIDAKKAQSSSVAPSTVADQYANGVRGTDAIGSYRNTGINGYQNTPGTPQLSATALAAQKANQAAYDAQQAKNNISFGADLTKQIAKTPATTSWDINNPAMDTTGLTPNPANGTGNNQVNFNPTPGSSPSSPSGAGNSASTTTGGWTPPDVKDDRPWMNPNLTDEQRNIAYTAYVKKSQEDILSNTLKQQAEAQKKQDNMNKAAGVPGAKVDGDQSLYKDPTSEGSTVDSITGNARIDSQLDISKQMLEGEQSDAQRIYDAQRDAQNRKLLKSLAGTNAQALAQAEGLNIYQMSPQELQNFAVSHDISLTQETKDRLNAGGKAALDTENLAKNEQLAQIQFAQDQEARDKQRALDEREQYNIQQDTKMRRMLGAYGGGVVGNLAGNAEVMRSLDEGQKALENLKADYANVEGKLALAANGVIERWNISTKEIQSQMATTIENAYGQISQAINDDIDSGITSELDLIKANRVALKEYAKSYMEATDKAYKDQQELNKTMFDQTMKLAEMQQKDDATAMTTTGTLWRNGKQLLDPAGNPIPTFDNMKFLDEKDHRLSQDRGYIYINGQPMVDADGNLVPTFDLQRFNEMNRQWTETYNFNVGKENNNTAQQDRMYALEVQKTNNALAQYNATRADKVAADDLSFKKWAIENKLIDPSQVTFGATPGNPGGYAVNPISPLNLANSKYAPKINDDGSVTFNIATGAKGGQCGRMVNDALGIPSFMTDTWEEKQAKVQTHQPVAGAAFVQKIAGSKNGHTGMVEKVYGDPQRPDAIDIVDSNFSNNAKDETVRRARIDITYDQNGDAIYTRNGVKQDITGFTMGVMKVAGTAGTPGFTLPGLSSSTGQPTFKNEQQANSWKYANRMADAEKNINDVASSITKMNPMVWMAQNSLPNWAPGKKEEVQLYQQAILNFVNAKLRQESGAVIGDSEYKKAEQQYFPQPGDSEKVLLQKERNRKMVIEDEYTVSGQKRPSFITGYTKDGDVVEIPENDYEAIDGLLAAGGSFGS